MARYVTVVYEIEDEAQVPEIIESNVFYQHDSIKELNRNGRVFSIAEGNQYARVKMAREAHRVGDIRMLNEALNTRDI